MLKHFKHCRIRSNQEQHAAFPALPVVMPCWHWCMHCGQKLAATFMTAWRRLSWNDGMPASVALPKSSFVSTSKAIYKWLENCVRHWATNGAQLRQNAKAVWEMARTSSRRTSSRRTSSRNSTAGLTSPDDNYSGTVFPIIPALNKSLTIKLSIEPPDFYQYPVHVTLTPACMWNPRWERQSPPWNPRDRPTDGTVACALT